MPKQNPSVLTGESGNGTRNKKLYGADADVTLWRRIGELGIWEVTGSVWKIFFAHMYIDIGDQK